MAHWLHEIREFQKKLQEEEELGGTPLTYRHAKMMGLLRPVGFRTPFHVLPQLDLLAQYGPWESKQEMLSNIVESAIHDFLADSPESVRQQFVDAVQAEMNKLNSGEIDLVQESGDAVPGITLHPQPTVFETLARNAGLDDQK